MPVKASPGSGQPQPSSILPARSRPIPGQPADISGPEPGKSRTGYLASLAAMANRSPRVQAQFKLAAEVQNSPRVHAPGSMAAAIQRKDGPGIGDPVVSGQETGTALRPAIASQTAPPVQLYRPVAKSEYAVKRSKRDKSSLFITQSKEPSLVKQKSKPHRIAHEIVHTKEKQDLNLADDGTIAINNTSADAKEFYAADSVFNSSAQKLKAAHSLVKLVKSSGLRIATEGKTLHKITPARADDQQQAGEFASLVSHICIKMASGLMGIPGSSKHEAVFQEPGSDEQRVANFESTEDKGDPKVDRLAALLGQSSDSFPKKDARGRLRAKIHEPGGDTIPGVKAYGEKSGKGQLDAREKKLGVNRYARPEVGEGYATFSTTGHAEKKIDYATGGDPEERPGSVWGYHFAGVVARSNDGNDSITLENYNRTDEVHKAIQVLLKRLIDTNRKKIEDEYESLQPVEGEHASVVQMKFMRAVELIQKDKDPGEEFNRLLGSYSATQAWFFKMQGSQAGQSFHEQQAESGGFVNPITLRVRPENTETKALREKCTQALRSFPQPPSQLKAKDELKDFLSLQESGMKAVKDAETQELIKSAFSNALMALAQYLLEGTAGAVVRLVGEHEAEVPKKLAESVTSAEDIAAKGKQATLLAERCYESLENKIQTFWITEVEEKLAAALDAAAIFQAWEYAPLVAAHYASNK